MDGRTSGDRKLHDNSPVGGLCLGGLRRPAAVRQGSQQGGARREAHGHSALLPTLDPKAKVVRQVAVSRYLRDQVRPFRHRRHDGAFH